MSRITIRPGTTKDAAVLRRIFELASHGLSPYMWRKAIGADQDYDQCVEARMIAKIQDPEQVFKIAEIDGKPVGGILTYRISGLQSLEGASAMMRSFLEVDNGLFPSVYVNAIAAFPEFRRLGVASALLNDARLDASRAGYPISLSVCDANADAISTYEANEYRHAGRVRMVKDDWPGAGEYWLLMVNESLCPWHHPCHSHWDAAQSLPPHRIAAQGDEMRS